MPSKKAYSEKEIVEGCVRNDRYFQELLYRRHFPAMMRFCMRYAGEQDRAMDILNQGFLRVFKKIHTFRFKGSLEGWIRRLVFHAISDYYKKEGKYLEVVFLDEKSDKAVDEQALSNLYLEDLMQLVDQLSPVTKDVFRMYAIEGYSHVEIAREMGISTGTSKWHLSNARKRLKALIDNNNTFRLHAG